MPAETCFSNKRLLSKYYIQVSGCRFDRKPRCFSKTGKRLWRINKNDFSIVFISLENPLRQPSLRGTHMHHTSTGIKQTCPHVRTKTKNCVSRCVGSVEEFTFTHCSRWFQCDEVCTLRNASV